jgi:hypothetical protein
MAKRLRNILIAFFQNLLTKWLEDFFIFAGIAVIIGTTYKAFGSVVGNYSLGVIFLTIGFLIAKK